MSTIAASEKAPASEVPDVERRIPMNAPTARMTAATTANATTVADFDGRPSMIRLKAYTTTPATIAAATGSSSGSAMTSRTSSL